MSTFPNERTEHAGTVLAHAMDPEASDPLSTAGRCLNTALHAMLTHERHAQGLRLPDTGLDTEGNPQVIAFESIRTKALELGTTLQHTWDGWAFAWLPYAERYLRHVESVYTYWRPCDCGCVQGGYPCEVGTMGAGCGS